MLLQLYYYGSYPYRWQRNRSDAVKGISPATVIYFHRIADDLANDWTTSNRQFARQITWLESRFELVSLEEVQRRVRAGTNRRPCVSITFDDGYADNAHQAIPLLVQKRIPCTYFVTLRNVLEGRPFAHDLAQGNRFAPNTLEQLRAMARAGVEIGAHCRDHVDLGPIHDPARLRDELVVSRDALRDAVDSPVRYFAFPFGLYANMNSEACRIAREAGYAGVCSGYGGYNFPGDDPFHLQRIAADRRMIRLKNRVSVDPRKVDVPRFEYLEATTEAVDSLNHALAPTTRPEDSLSDCQPETLKS